MSASPIKSWPDYLLAQAKALYESGKHSAQQIAVQIGHGKSRNAVIGEAHRKGWHNPNPKKGGTKPGEKRPRATRLRIVPNWARPIANTVIEQPDEIPKPDNFLGLTIQDLEQNECRYPAGEELPYLFCGQPTQDGSSYCAFHHRVCWQRPTGASRQFEGRQKF